MRWKIGKSTNLWELNNMLLNNQEDKEEITREITKYHQRNENRSKTYQNIRDPAKAVLRKFTAVINEIKKEKKISNQQPNFRPQRIINIRAEISKIEDRKSIEKSMKVSLIKKKTLIKS